MLPMEDMNHILLSVNCIGLLRGQILNEIPKKKRDITDFQGRVFLLYFTTDVIAPLPRQVACTWITPPLLLYSSTLVLWKA